jgi:hypothetical protein
MMHNRRLTLCEVAVREYFYKSLRADMYALRADMREAA